jgi:long-chain acyl-CoA synthetase
LAKAKSTRPAGAKATNGVAPVTDAPVAEAAEKQKPKRPSRKKAAPASAAEIVLAEPDGAVPDVVASKPAVAKAPDKPWLKSYPEGMPATIGPLPAASVGEFMANACRQYARRPAFTLMGTSLSFADIERLSSHFAGYLQSTGLKEGARVAIMMPNLPQGPIAIMAALRAGFVVVNVNPLYTARELEHQLKDSGAEAIVILENFAKTLQQAIAGTSVKHVIVAAMGDLLGLKGMFVNFVVRRVKKMVPDWWLPGHVRFNEALKIGARKTFRPARVIGDDIAFLQYTGGTTGVSKGAMLLHRNVLANVEQNGLWVRDAYRVKAKPDDLTYLCALPLYHIFALTINALMGMHQGANNIMIPNPRDIPALVKEMRKHPIHVFPGLNTLFNALLNNEEFGKLDFSPMVLTLAGGMAVQRAVAERWFKVTGCPITEGYGLSETSPVATANRFSSTEFTGTIGLPLPSTEIAIRDDQDTDLAIGEVGEICIRGPQVMAGYWNRPDETAKVMSADGYFRTGDIGRMDERGYVTIVDRKKDMILVSGFKVFPNEVEDVIARHPGVLEVAVVGVPDEHSGEVPKLYVVKKVPALTAEDLAAYCRENLTGYKRPRYIEFRTELPKSNVGKILRRELKG